MESLWSLRKYTSRPQNDNEHIVSITKAFPKPLTKHSSAIEFFLAWWKRHVKALRRVEGSRNECHSRDGAEAEQANEEGREP